MNNYPFENGLLTKAAVSFGYQRQSRLSMMADIYEKCLFYKNTTFLNNYIYHQPSRGGLESEMTRAKRFNLQKDYVHLIECVLDDIISSKYSNISLSPTFYEFEVNKPDEIKIEFRLKSTPGTDRKFYKTVKERYSDDNSKKLLSEEYYSSKFYKEHNQEGINFYGEIPTGTSDDFRNKEISFVYGFDTMAEKLFSSFRELSYNILLDPILIKNWILHFTSIQAPELFTSVSNTHVQVEKLSNTSVKITTDLNIKEIVEYHEKTAKEEYKDAFYDRHGDLDKPIYNQDVLPMILTPLLDELINLTRSNIEFQGVYNSSQNFGGLNFYKRMLEKHSNSISNFSEFVLGKTGIIKEKIINQEANPFDLLKLYERSENWRKWTSQISNEENIIHDYIKEISTDQWISKLPSKVIRFIVVTATGLGADALGAGGIGTASAIGVGALDHFLVEHTIKGFTPKQFVTQIQKL